MPHITLSDVAAIIGMVLGTAGFVTSVLSYFRDRPVVKVTLKWNMQQAGTEKVSGVVRVTNLGRRPVFIGAVALLVPKGFKDSHLLLMESIPGKKLSEGDGPAGYLVNYDGLEKYAEKWRDVRGSAEDSAGRTYVSKKLPERDIPSWAKTR
jgi:hypothetical protein